jgi:hypothetical protein
VLSSGATPTWQHIPTSRFGACAILVAHLLLRVSGCTHEAPSNPVRREQALGETSRLYRVPLRPSHSSFLHLRGGTMATAHGTPPDGLECMCTFEDIDSSNYVEYQTAPSGLWHPSKFCADVVQEMLDTQYSKYMHDVEKASRDCAAAVRRLVTKGPPVFLSDPHGLPMPDGDTHIEKVWFCSGTREVSAQLKGALIGAEREELWNVQKEMLAAMEAAEKTDPPQ